MSWPATPACEKCPKVYRLETASYLMDYDYLAFALADGVLDLCMPEASR